MSVIVKACPPLWGESALGPAKDSCGALHSREGLVVVVVDLEVVLAAEAARAGPRSVAMMTRAAKVTGARCSRREFGVTGSNVTPAFLGDSAASR